MEQSKRFRSPKPGKIYRHKKTGCQVGSKTSSLTIGVPLECENRRNLMVLSL